MIDMATTVYAKRTPIDNMLTRAERSNRAAKNAVRMAAQSVAITGVLKRCEMNENSWKIRPSCAIE